MFLRSELPYIPFYIWQIPANIIVIKTYLSHSNPSKALSPVLIKSLINISLSKNNNNYENVYSMSAGQMANITGRRHQSLFDAVPAFFCCIRVLWAGCI